MTGSLPEGEKCKGRFAREWTGRPENDAIEKGGSRLSVTNAVALAFTILAWLWPDAPFELKAGLTVVLVVLILVDAFILPNVSTFKGLSLADYLRLASETVQGAVIGLGAGLFFADSFLSQPVYEIIQFFPGEPGTALPTGQSTMSMAGLVLIAVAGAAGAAIALYYQYRALMRRKASG